MTLDQGHSDSTFSNFFSRETARPIDAKFDVDPPWDWGTKVCSNGPGHMTKMAAMPIYGTKKPMTLKVDMQHRVLEYYEIYSNDDTGLTLTYFIVSLMLLYGKKVKQWIFQKLLWSMMSKLVDAIN